ncbi:MAG: TIR domain-containing protein [Gaiellaceae bacterium]
MAELDDVKQQLQRKLGIGERQVNRVIQKCEGETLLPRRLAILLLASENGISIRKHASEDDLSQLRAVRGGAAVAPPQAVPAPEPRQGERRQASRRRTSQTKPARPKRPTRGRKVFVVHGRNESLRKDLFSFLRSLALQPLEWRKAIEAAGKGSPHISEIIDAAFNEAVAVVVLLSPDDQVRLSEQFQRPGDPPYEKELVGQARPNVLFEAGMAFGRHPNSTVLIQVGDVKPFSDVGGRHVTRLANDPESRSEVVTKLKNAGCAVDDGGTDWYSVGDFRVGGDSE